MLEFLGYKSIRCVWSGKTSNNVTEHFMVGHALFMMNVLTRVKNEIVILRMIYSESVILKVTKSF